MKNRSTEEISNARNQGLNERSMNGLAIPPGGFDALHLSQTAFCTQGVATHIPVENVFANDAGPPPMFAPTSVEASTYFQNGDRNLVAMEMEMPIVYPPLSLNIPSAEQAIPYDASQNMTPLNYDLLTHFNDAPGTLPLTFERTASKRQRRERQSKRKPLVRNQLIPVSPETDHDSGRRRRGRPPGSGNRKPMIPKTGPDGVRRFHSRSALYTGVYRTKAGRWRSQFSHRGQVVQLGMFDDEQTAAHRWDLEAIRLRGADTQINFPHLKPLYVSLLEDMYHISDARCTEMSDLIDERLIQQEIMDRAVMDPTEVPPPAFWQEVSEPPELNLYPPTVMPTVDNNTVGVNGSSLMDHPLLSSLLQSIPAEQEHPSSSPTISTTTTASVKWIVESFVMAADKEIKSSALRASHALKFIQYGENLRREAQQSYENNMARKEEAKKILCSLQHVMGTSEKSR